MSPRGGCKEFKHSNITLRWYIESQSLILDGEQADVVKDKLVSSAQQNQEILDEMTSDEESDVLCNDNEHNGGEEERSQHPSHMQSRRPIARYRRLYRRRRRNKPTHIVA